MRSSCIWGGWSDWSGCNHPCGNSGTRVRTRGIIRGMLPAVVHHAADPVETSEPATGIATMEDIPKMATVPVQQLFSGKCCETSEYFLNII